MTGTYLPVCTTNDDQCCSVRDVETILMNVRQRLEIFLGEEFEGVIEDYKDEINNLRKCKLINIV